MCRSSIWPQRFSLASEAEHDNRFVVLCEAEGSAKVALIVDDIIGQQQVVIKSLEENFERVEGIAGGTILGDGNVALIVDVQGLKTAIVHKNAAQQSRVRIKKAARTWLRVPRKMTGRPERTAERLKNGSARFER